MDAMSIVAHSTREPVFVPGAAKWRVECSCGWNYTTRFHDDAATEALDHVNSPEPEREDLEQRLAEVTPLRPPPGPLAEVEHVTFGDEDEAKQTEAIAQRMAAQSLLLTQLQQKVEHAGIEEVPDMGGQVVALQMENGAKILLQVGQVRVEVTE